MHADRLVYHHCQKGDLALINATLRPALDRSVSIEICTVCERIPGDNDEGQCEDHRTILVELTGFDSGISIECQESGCGFSQMTHTTHDLIHVTRQHLRKHQRN